MSRLSCLTAAGGGGWQAWHPTAAMFFLNGALFGMWATQIPAFRDRLQLSPASLGLVLLTLSAGTALAMASSAFLIRLAGATRVIRVSALLYCGLGTLVPLAPDTPVLAIVVMLFGGAGGSMNLAINTHATDVQRAAGRPFMSSFHGMWSLGGFAGSGGGALLLRGVSPSAEAAVIAAVMVLLLAREHRGLRPLRHPGASGPVQRGISGAATGTTLLLGAMAALAFSGEGVVLDWAAVYMRQSLEAGAQLALVGYVAFAASMAIMRFAATACGAAPVRPPLSR